MKDLLSNLNERQQEAVLTTEGPLMVLAGAGSGKTKMLTSRISYLIEGKGVAGSQILAMTFTNRAAAEMRERVEKNLGISMPAHLGYSGMVSDTPEIGTFHSVCVRLLRREMLHTPFTKPFVIYDDSDQLHLIKSVLTAFDLDEKKFNPKAIQHAINRAKCDAQGPEEMVLPTHSLFAKQTQKVYEKYQSELFANNALDFGEIICMAYRLFRDNLEVRAKYQNRFKYIHVDEYQDTNRAQYLLLSMLASPEKGGHQNICVVGDEDQSIYKWRGADIKNILDFEKEYPGAKVVKLEQNYRSSKSILNVANEVIRNNTQRKHKVLWTDNPEGSRVIHAQLADERAEAEMVVSEMKRLAAEGRAYSDFALFYRTHAQSRQFEDVLRREKIPYQVVGGLRFYDRKEIKDVLAYFKLILNPADLVSLKRVINVPARGIGKTTLDKLDQVYYSRRTEFISFWDVLELAAQDSSITSSGASKKIRSFVELVKKITAESQHSLLSELYHLILDSTGYVQELKQEDTEESLSRIENLEEFNSLLQEFEEEQLEQVPDPEKHSVKSDLLPRFLEQTALASEGDRQGEGLDSSTKLMTLHSSKGLEFPVVFLVGMEEGLFPSIKAWEEAPEEAVEEERRLCYVGMTRAREFLYLSNVIIRRIWGSVSYQQPSRFFSEMTDEWVEMRDFSSGVKSTEFRTGSSRQFGYSQTPSVQSVVREDRWVGKQLLHPDYGRGTIVESEGLGLDQKVVIQFSDRQKRKFLFRYVANYIT